MAKKQSISGVSQAIQSAILACENNNIREENTKEFTIKIANTLEEREKAFRLAYEVYLEKGYLTPNNEKWLVNSYDANQDTVVLIVLDKQKNIAGSLTLVFDKNFNLPADKIYLDELKSLRTSESNLAEISRLVINNRYRNSKEILILLFNYLCIYVHHVKNCNGIIAQVNPRHKAYYTMLLSFQEIGDEKPCPQVKNAPAVLLYLPTNTFISEIKRCHIVTENSKKERTLYPFFLRPEQESLVANYLENHVKPMTIEEKLYFGFSESGISRAVSV